MVKNIVAIAMLASIVMLPTVSLAAVPVATQVSTTPKISGSAQVIRLASNDLSQVQSVDRKLTAKESANDDIPVDLTQIPPQAWLVLTALFCFVMRSSRRTV